MTPLPPQIVVTAKAGVGIQRIRLLVGESESADPGLALLTSVMPGVRELDRLTRAQGVADGR